VTIASRFAKRPRATSPGWVRKMLRSTSMDTIPVAEASSQLAELIAQADKRTIVIVAGEHAVRLVPMSPARSAAPGRPGFGIAAGQFHMSDDFDAPLADFAEYM